MNVFGNSPQNPCVLKHSCITKTSICPVYHNVNYVVKYFEIKIGDTPKRNWGHPKTNWGRGKTRFPPSPIHFDVSPILTIVFFDAL